MGNYQKLGVWQSAHRLTLAVYQVTIGFPATERFGVVSQLRRAAASIAANIAEGCGRNNDRELVRFLRYSLGSASEVEYFLPLSKELGFLNKAEWEELTVSVRSVKSRLTSLINRARRSADSR